MTHEEIVEKLYKMKTAMNWTYDDLARKTGYSKSAVARLFQYKNVNIFMLLDICQAMGIEVRVV